MSFFDAKELYINDKKVQELYLNGGKVYPKGYIMLNYIQSYGKEYIDTGVHVNPNYTVSVDFKVTKATTIYDTIFGTRGGGSANTNTSQARFTARFANSASGALGVHRSTSKNTNYESIADGNAKKNSCMSEFHNVLLDKNKYYFDGTLRKTFTASSNYEEFVHTLYLFANNNVGKFSDAGYFQIKHCSIKDENKELVRDFYPCQRIEDGEIGMLDKVTGEFYGNQGDGAFTGE